MSCIAAMLLNGIADRGISSGSRLIPGSNKKNTQIRFPLGALGQQQHGHEELQSAGLRLDCNSCDRQAFVPKMSG
jgi:hypothetical protein